MTKRCWICKLELEITNFKVNKTRKDGFQTQCISCQSEYRKKHYQKNKDKYIKMATATTAKVKKWLAAYKETQYCIECGQNHVATIDFHHIDPKTKKFTIGRAPTEGFSIEAIEEEIKKCIVLCSNCHRILHWKEKQKKKNKLV